MGLSLSFYGFIITRFKLKVNLQFGDIFRLNSYKMITDGYTAAKCVTVSNII